MCDIASSSNSGSRGRHVEVRNVGPKDKEGTRPEDRQEQRIEATVIENKPGLCFRRISASSVDLSKSKSQESRPPSGYLSPTPQKPLLQVSTPPSSMSHDAATLAQLYHSSRRSRHGSPQRSRSEGQAHIIKSVPPPPLVLPVEDVVEDENTQIWQQMEEVISGTDEVEWSFDIASPVCDDSAETPKSLGSSESVVSFMDMEDGREAAVMASEVFDEVEDDEAVEREAKRRRTMPTAA